MYSIWYLDPDNNQHNVTLTGIGSNLIAAQAIWDALVLCGYHMTTKRP